ncbi:hypothetical protein ACFSO7_02985 [Bacillus sp. CGMCC 1.16607]|uniref:hypothetical protein n=1 Tax=Bacillus sp. CGMCC 1.16607 TaxID=3351842 RepID=UPI00363CADB3
MNITIKPLTDQFNDPIYPVLVEIELPNRKLSEVVLFNHDREFGEFDFGKLKDYINGSPKTFQNRIKNEIKEVIFKS